jgi:hypothetical protein
MGGDYRINVREVSQGHFRLFNHDEPCGSRLFKSQGMPLENKNPPKGLKSWEEPVFHYTDEWAATDAAELLQDYLDSPERFSGTKKKKKKAK